MKLTPWETILFIAFLLVLIVGGIVRLHKKGWTQPDEEPSMSTNATPASR